MAIGYELNFPAKSAPHYPAGESHRRGGHVVFGVVPDAERVELQEFATVVLIGCVTRRRGAIKKYQHGAVGRNAADQLAEVTKTLVTDEVEVVDQAWQILRDLERHREVVVPEPSHSVLQWTLSLDKMSHPTAERFEALFLTKLLVFDVVEISPWGWLGGNSGTIRVEERIDIGRCPRGLKLVELARGQTPGDSTGEECDVVSCGHTVMINMTCDENVMSVLEPVEGLSDVVDEVLR